MHGFTIFNFTSELIFNWRTKSSRVSQLLWTAFFIITIIYTYHTDTFSTILFHAWYVLHNFSKWSGFQLCTAYTSECTNLYLLLAFRDILDIIYNYVVYTRLPQDTRPVSYTHLDVYKRQEIFSLPVNNFFSSCCNHFCCF